MDRNRDGLLDANEVQNAIREFYTSDNPQAPGNLIFGPLPIPATGKNGERHGASMKAASSNGAPSKRSAKKRSATVSAKQ